MNLQLPLRTDATPHYTMEVQLEGSSYTFEFKWNSRSEFWTFNISDATGDELVSGRRIVTGFPPLLARFKDDRMPPGNLFAVDTTGAGADPVLEDLGTRVLLVYVPES